MKAQKYILIGGYNMSEFTTQLFLDVKKFERYQAMLKKSVHLEEARTGKYQLAGYPDSHNFHRVLRALGAHSEGLTNRQLIFEYNFKPSDLKDGVKALTSNNLATKEEINDHEYLVKLTTEGDKRAEALVRRRNEIAEAAYGFLSDEEQRELDHLINKMIDNYEKRDLNYEELRNMI